MTEFTEIEQETTDIEWFAIDKDGRIGHFTHGGFQLLPPTVAKSKESLEKLKNFFDELPNLSESNFAICSDFEKNNDLSLITDIDGYIKPSAKMSKKGLYAYDSSPNVSKRPYLRVTIPQNELALGELPNEIKNLLESLRINEIDFSKDSLISAEITDKL